MPEDRKIVPRVKNVDGVRTTVMMDVTDRIPGKGTRKYIKSRQCATVFKNGRLAGRRCSWYATEGSVHCRRHEGNHMPTNHDERRSGHADWIARIRALNKTNPDAVRRLFNIDQMIATRRKNKEIEATLLPRPTNPDPIVLKAHKALVREVAALPTIPQKPFDQLEPHEQQIFNTRLALKRSHEILEIKLTEKKIENNPKLASMVKDAALRTIATTVKIDSNHLQARKLDRMGELLQRLKAPDDPKLIDG